MKKVVITLVVGAMVLGGFYYLNFDKKPAEEQNQKAQSDFKSATFVINGRAITLVNGVSEENVPNSSAKIITRYFGNELKTDLDNDGREDVVFLLTQTEGGSGTFFYIVASLNTPDGYLGSDGYLLGDRIAPQTTEMSRNPRHKQVIVVNFAERAPSEPMTTAPSVGKSVYLKIDPATMQWGIVEPNFEGESAGS